MNLNVTGHCTDNELTLIGKIKMAKETNPNKTFKLVEESSKCPINIKEDNIGYFGRGNMMKPSKDTEDTLEITMLDNGVIGLTDPASGEVIEIYESMDEFMESLGCFKKEE